MHTEMRIIVMSLMLLPRKRAHLRLNCESQDNGRIPHLLLRPSLLRQCCNFLGVNGSIVLVQALNGGASLGTEGALPLLTEAPRLKEGVEENITKEKENAEVAQRRVSQCRDQRAS